MPYARVWIEPGGVIKVTILTPGAEMAQVAQVLRDNGHVHLQATFFDVETRDDLLAAVPTDRGKRHKWRKHPTLPRIFEDPAVLDPVPPV